MICVQEIKPTLSLNGSLPKNYKYGIPFPSYAPLSQFFDLSSFVVSFRQSLVHSSVTRLPSRSLPYLRRVKRRPEILIMDQKDQGNRRLLPIQPTLASTDLDGATEPSNVRKAVPELPPQRKQRRSGAPTIDEAEWTRVEDRIKQLYVIEGQKLEDVRSILEHEEDFRAT